MSLLLSPPVNFCGELFAAPLPVLVMVVSCVSERWRASRTNVWFVKYLPSPESVRQIIEIVQDFKATLLPAWGKSIFSLEMIIGVYALRIDFYIQARDFNLWGVKWKYLFLYITKFHHTSKIHLNYESKRSKVFREQKVS